MPSSKERPGASQNDEQLHTVAANVRALREAQRLTLGQLAARSGVSKAALSKLEASATNPTLETLTALATALSATTAELVTLADVATVHVVRRDEGLNITDAAAAARVLHAKRSGSYSIEVHEMTCAPGQEETSTTHGDGSWEHLFVIEGNASVGPLNESVWLGPGDYAAYPTHLLHNYRNEGSTTLRMLIFLIIPRIGETALTPEED
jgi:transcriptional regulator with XRE-family HTH domain